MGKQTIAEFVENGEILERLREIGVDYVQGFGIGKPVPFEALCDGRLSAREVSNVVSG
jgi:EAL domain-containing protein (putative c-di-GMP-specific phosphodiesterase class I)